MRRSPGSAEAQKVRITHNRPALCGFYTRMMASQSSGRNSAPSEIKTLRRDSILKTDATLDHRSSRILNALHRSINRRFHGLSSSAASVIFAIAKTNSEQPSVADGVANVIKLLFANVINFLMGISGER